MSMLEGGKPAYLTDILVLDPAYLLNVRGALRNIL